MVVEIGNHRLEGEEGVIEDSSQDISRSPDCPQ